MIDTKDPADHRALTRLDGRGIIVLGAGGEGMGTATARLLAAAGARVMCVDIREDLASAVADEVGGEAYAANVTDRTEMEKLFAHADRVFGKHFAGLVDIVGGGGRGRLASFDDAAIDQLLALNLRQALLAIQIGAPMLAARGGGTMAFVGSIAGIAVAPGQPIYAMAKAGLHHLVRQAADEFGPRGVRLNVVAPGVVERERWTDKADMLSRIAGETPLRRVGNVRDVANVLYFLMTDLSSYMTGTVLNVDGGKMIGANLPRTQADED